MKKIFYVLFTLIALNTFAQIGEPIQINTAGQVQFSGHDGFKVIGDEIYLTYIQDGDIIFSYSDDNGQSFNEIEIDVGYTSVLNRNTEPILEVLSDGTAVIIYLSKEHEDLEHNNYLKKAVRNSTGDFEIELIDFDVFEKPAVTISDDVVTLFYNSGLSRNLSEYVYFSLNDESENADYSQESAAVKFWGPDVMDGPVHSNTDIWIQNGGGGNNDGWPTFNGFSSTSGIFRNYNQSGAPLTDAQKEQIFLGDPFPGYEETSTQLDFDDDIESIQMNGIHIVTQSDILYIKMHGQTYTSMRADIEFTGIQEFEVYSWFPSDAGLANTVTDIGGNWYEDSDSIWTNYIAIYDTVWSQGPSGNLSGSTFYVDCEMWIEGYVDGATTFACSDTVYIVGDITYANTPVGEDPSDTENLNRTDSFGLISEENIIISYKHRDPFNNMVLREDNCNDINLYGAYAAIGKGNPELYGEQNCHHEGIFTFQYQHPHGSTPDFTAMNPYTGQDTLYSYIDFHKFIFPTYDFVPEELAGFKLHSNNPTNGLICGYPVEGHGFPDPNGYNGSYPNNEPHSAFPYGTDYPWYNPVWPESSLDIVSDRGTMNLWGSIIQSRRGYVHRSGNDSYNHGEYHSDSDSDCDECLYDFDNFLFGGTHIINGEGTGYAKNYSYDKRFNSNPPLNFPICYSSDQRIIVLQSNDFCESFSELYNEEVLLPTKIIGADSENEDIVSWFRNETQLFELYSENGGDTFITQEINTDFQLSEIKSLRLLNGNVYVHTNDKQLFSNDYDRVYVSELQNSTINLVADFAVSDEITFSDFNISNAENLTLLWTYDSEPGEPGPGFYYSLENAEFNNFMYWEPGMLIESMNFAESKMSIQFNEDDVVYIMLYKVPEDETETGNLYLYSGNLDGITVNAEDEAPAADFSLSIFPNPFNPSLSIQFNVSGKDAKDAKISIYNVKGQKVRQFSDFRDQKAVIWNGTDETGKRVSSGTYFIKLTEGKKEIIKKAVLIK